MKIKPQHLLRSFLLLPYLAWGLALLLTNLIQNTGENSNFLSALLNVVVGIVSIYAIGILLWGIPYTILALGLLVWSIHKPALTISKVFTYSPLLLAILMIFEVVLVSFFPLQAPTLGSMKELLLQTLVVAIPSFAFGYFFVGASLILFKVITHLNLKTMETEAK